MKSFYIFLLIVFLVPVSVLAQPGFGTAVTINEDWQFRLNEGKWEPVDLPHDWSVRQKLDPKLASCMGYLPGGIGWYQKNISIPKAKNGQKVYLYFEGVYNHSEVFINKQSLGKRPNGYVSFMYDATPYVKYGQQNEIEIHVDHSKDADSRWYTGSGIYRNVWLVYANPVHFSQWGIYAYPEIKNKQGIVNVNVEIENNGNQKSALTIINELIAPDGKIVSSQKMKKTLAAQQSEKINTRLIINNPLLWDIAKPHLYQLKTTLLKGKEKIDETITNTGFRIFSFDPDKGFALNGIWMKMKGVCLHHDAGVLGAAVPKEVWRRRLLALKEIGCNAIRTSHNPQAPDLYNLCDELGILVMNEAFDEWEFPKRKWLEGWNVGTPGFQGSYNFFKEWGKKDLSDMVKRDRNHISIFAWSIGNEVDYPNDPYSHPILDGGGQSGFTQKMFGGYKKDAPDAMRLGVIAKELASVVKEYDKTRPVTAGLAGVAMSNETGYPDALDIAGYNYTENRYGTDHKKYPHRVIYGSENRQDLDAWKQVVNNQHIFGQFLWTGIDYLGESGRWPSRGFYSGLLDVGGFMKPRGYYRKALWSDKPVVYIGTYPLEAAKKTDDVLSQAGNKNKKQKAISMDAWPSWNYKTNEIIRVVCYNNTRDVKLLLNNKEVNQPKQYDAKTGIIYWDIPYKAGTLEAIGTDNAGTKLATCSVTTTEQPYALKVVAINSGTNKKSDVVQLLIQVLDKNNQVVPYADNEITCALNGAANLLGLEAGNNTDMGDYTDNKQKVYRGRMIAYIKKRAGSKGVSINFSASGLKSAVLEL